MARYTGPRTKKSRTFGEPIFGYDKAFEKRKYAPGQHGNSRKRSTKSEYAVQLKEKQKAKYTYGILERQFYKTFEEAARKHGVTGENLLRLLEQRLDNTIYRLGFAPTRSAARQLVNTQTHYRERKNIKRIPSYTVKVNDVVSIREKSKNLEVSTRYTEASGRVKKYSVGWN
jgi:small subunit ribosomal protein S4